MTGAIITAEQVVPRKSLLARARVGLRVLLAMPPLLLPLLLLLGVGAPAHASVRALPAPSETPIDRASLDAASPRVSGPDNTAREKTLQTLRRTAQGDENPLRKQRPPAARATAEKATADAAWLLGLLALHGLAMPADPPQAQHWFERAHMFRHPLAPAGLAWCQLSGCIAAPNPAAATQWIALARRADPGLAKYLEWHAAKALAPMADPRAENRSGAPPLSAALDAGALAPPPASPALLQLLTEASRAGNAQAKNELGLETLAAGDLEQALVQFQSAAARSDAAAANASLLTHRIKTRPAHRAPPARYSAADWYAEARRYHHGDGVPANYAEAVRLYQIAASSGDPQARRMLALIFSRPAPDGTVDVTWMQQLAAMDLGPTGLAPGASRAVNPQSWQRDPSPLYEWVPREWKASGTTTGR
ncbi:MAG: hypothetical protein ACK41V_12380 [Acidovorax sp.]|uniref:SEL1-like repeat protein n=1 Tax=Acidovorax sp. TaxID=1872122 RepID=UPI00391B839E